MTQLQPGQKQNTTWPNGSTRAGAAKLLFATR